MYQTGSPMSNNGGKIRPQQQQQQQRRLDYHPYSTIKSES